MKKYRITHNVGKVKYLLSYCTGLSFHSDGSLFWDIRCFKNKIKLALFEKDLLKNGYKYQ